MLKKTYILQVRNPASVPKVRETITTPEVTITEFQKYLKNLFQTIQFYNVQK